MVKKRKQTVVKGASSALIISVAVHLIILLVAGSFVAVEVIQRQETKFEAKQIVRPKMKLKKLQVPVKVEKKLRRQAPKLSQRLTATPRVKTKAVDFEMPEMTGFGKGTGVGISGSGLGGSLGFSTGEIDLFGIRGQGEKIFIILDASARMMVDELGGIPAYTIIKSELLRIMKGLNPTVLFNVAAYDGTAFTRFPEMVAASDSNIEKVDEWLKPLNAAKKGMKDIDYGTKTLGPGGTKIDNKLQIEPLQNAPGYWVRPTLLAMKSQADAVFVLTCTWGALGYKTDELVTRKQSPWDESDQERYEENVAEARQLFKVENDRRRKRGKPPRVILNGDFGLLAAYLPNAPKPPPKGAVFNVPAHYTPDELAGAFANMREKWIPKRSVEIGLKKRNNYSIHVIRFIKADGGTVPEERFSQLVRRTHGKYREIEGMDAIKSYVSAGDEE